MFLDVASKSNEFEDLLASPTPDLAQKRPGKLPSKGALRCFLWCLLAKTMMRACADLLASPVKDLVQKIPGKPLFSGGSPGIFWVFASNSVPIYLL